VSSSESGVVTESSGATVPAKHAVGIIAGRWGLVGVLAVFVALGVVYSVTTPVFETPDEPWHFVYAKRLADGQGLPPLTFSTDPWVQGEAHQPPLYYALAAVTMSWVDTGDWQEEMQRNPHAAPGAPHSFGNKNVVLHPAQSRGNWTGTRLAVHVVRFLSIALGAMTVWMTYELVREVRPGSRLLALSAAAIVAFNPQFIFISSAVNNDSLITVLSSLALLLMIRGMSHRMPLWRYAVLGLVIGAAILTKLGGFGLLIPAILSIAWVAHEERDWRPFVVRVAVVLLVALLVSGWWYIRNLVQYQDPLGMRAMTTAFRTHDEVPTIPELLRTTGDAEISYWGVFGWMNVIAGEWFYVGVRALARLAAVGVVLLLIRRRRESPILGERGPQLIALAVWGFAVLCTLVNWSRQVTGPQGRLLFPAVSVVATFLVVGLSALSRGASQRTLLMIVALFLLIGAVVSPFAYISPAYAKPPVVNADELPGDARHVNISYGNGIQLAAYRIDQSSVAPGDDLDVYLYWQAEEAMEEDFSAFVHLLGRDREWLGQMDSYPGRGNLPTSSWKPGQMICDHYRVTVAESATVPVAGRIEVGLYRLPGYTTVPARDGQGRDIGGSPGVGVIRVAAQDPIVCQPARPAEVVFGDTIQLSGYDLSRDRLSVGEEVTVTLHWLSVAPTQDDYTVFIHLVGPEGGGGQEDGQPLEGDFPTSLWVPGETVVDHHVLEVRSDAAFGEYHLEVGLYLLSDGKRLVASGAGDRGRDYAILGPVEVVGP